MAFLQEFKKKVLYHISCQVSASGNPVPSTIDLVSDSGGVGQNGTFGILEILRPAGFMQ